MLSDPATRRRLPRVDAREVAAIFAGGALGTAARAGLAEAFPHSPVSWPWPTFAVNIVAAFLLGYFVTRLQERLPLSSYRRPLGRGFPFGTFAINVSGAMILGLLAGLALGHDQALLAGTAAVGSYTTFSTWMFETERLAEERQAAAAVANVLASLVLGVAAAALGRYLGTVL